MRDGRPSKFKKRYCKELLEFFSISHSEQVLKREIIHQNGKVEREYITLAAGLPTLNKFSTKIGVHVETVHSWADDSWPDDHPDPELRGQYKHPDFHLAWMKAKQLQRDFLVDNGLAGLTPPAAFIFVATNITDMRNKQDVDHTSNGKPITITTVSYEEVAKKYKEAQALKALPAPK